MINATITGSQPTNPSTQAENGTHTNESAQSHRRTRACVACRNMKIRCISIPGSRDCENCLRFSRPCQDPGPPKARLKTSQKFSELEKKIDALSSALDLERRRNQQPLRQVTNEAQWPKTPDSDSRGDALPSTLLDGQSSTFARIDGSVNVTVIGDVVEQGLIDMLSASLLFDHWNLHMRPLMPVVQFSAEEDVHFVRAKKPTLFLTIMTIASTLIRPALVPRLLTQLNNTLAQDAFIQGGRSLDLLQSLILFSHYYIQPAHIKTFALPQHVYSAVVMSHDLGLAAMPRLYDKGDTGKAKEASRTVLAVYFGASCSATFLRRHQPFLFTSSHRDFIETLTRADDGNGGDRWLCSLVTLQEILDDATKTLHASQSGMDESFDDFRTQHLLGIFRQKVADWRLSPSGDIHPRLKEHAGLVADLYIHQIAIRSYNLRLQAWDKDKSESDQQTPPLSVVHTDALCHCLKVCLKILNIYLVLDDMTARSLSNAILLWNMRAAVCLIKLGHFAYNLSRYRTAGDDFSYDPSFTLEFLEAIIQKLTRLSSNGYFPQSLPFLVAFKKLKLWSLQKKTVCMINNGNCVEEETYGPVHDILGPQTPPASPPATTLNTHAPSEARSDGQEHMGIQLESQFDFSDQTAVLATNQQSLGWDPDLQIPNDVTVAGSAFVANYNPLYSNANLGDMGLYLDDMREINNFMEQADDEGLWSLL
ncbi:hypothetical protein GGR54DRAFT_631222 [Hypoxylon sp. NC1633]|nr:hypothetical protein GGR54DRAFT_631222 [Hypoxylon sp. NC1633]